MKIDWDKKAHAGSLGETAAVLTRSRRRAGLESLSVEAAGAGPSEHERLDRLGEALAASRPAVPEADAGDIKEKVLAGAKSGLAKVNQGAPAENFTLGEHIGLEAVIITNGERPSLFVRNGFVDLAAPDVGAWNQDLQLFRDAIRGVIASVGRVNVPVDPFFAGSCFVVAEGLVITNRHVLEEIATQDATGAWTLNFPSRTTIDFIGEDGVDQATRFRVTGVAFAGPDPINNTINFAHLDMAILRVDPASDAAHTFPHPVTFETNTAQPMERNDLYVVGFPGKPRIWAFQGTPRVGFETAEVLSTLFSDKFGVKKLAPGKVKGAPGSIAGDAKKWICTHDASTLGGNSGSCVADLTGDGFRVMALHFAGANRAQNWAHVAAQLRPLLAAFSAMFVA